MTLMTSFLCFYCLLRTDSTYCSIVLQISHILSIVEFEQIHAGCGRNSTKDFMNSVTPVKSNVLIIWKNANQPSAEWFLSDSYILC